jgi:hypothetical protein
MNDWEEQAGLHHFLKRELLLQKPDSDEMLTVNNLDTEFESIIVTVKLVLLIMLK